MLLKPYLDDGGMQRKIQPGDTVVSGEIFPAAVVTTATTITGAILSSGWYNRALAANGTDTVDTAANIIAAIAQGLGYTGVQPGTAWRFTIYNGAAFTDTVAASANSGVTVTAGAIAASSVKEFIVTVVNGTPTRTVAVVSTNGSAVLTGIATADLAALTVGMVVTSATSGLQGTTIIAINTAGNSVTMSGNANATAAVTPTFSPVLTLQGIGQRAV